MFSPGPSVVTSESGSHADLFSPASCASSVSCVTPGSDPELELYGCLEEAAALIPPLPMSAQAAHNAYYSKLNPVTEPVQYGLMIKFLNALIEQGLGALTEETLGSAPLLAVVFMNDQMYLYLSGGCGSPMWDGVFPTMVANAGATFDDVVKATLIQPSSHPEAVEEIFKRHTPQARACAEKAFGPHYVKEKADSGVAPTVLGGVNVLLSSFKVRDPAKKEQKDRLYTSAHVFNLIAPCTVCKAAAPVMEGVFKVANVTGKKHSPVKDFKGRSSSAPVTAVPFSLGG